MKALKGDKKMADGLALENFVIANTEAAYEALGAQNCENPHCVRCGSPIKYVFVTNKGALGGDCLATLTGDNTTRKIARKFTQSLNCELSYGWRLNSLVVEKAHWQSSQGKVAGCVYAKMWHPDRSRFNSYEGTYICNYKHMVSFSDAQETMMEAYISHEAEERNVAYSTVDDINVVRRAESGW